MTDGGGHDGRRSPSPSPAGSERPFSRRRSSARLDAVQVIEEHLVATVRAAIRSAIGRAFDLAEESMRQDVEAARNSARRADVAQLELQRDLRWARDELATAREELALSREKAAELQQALDDTAAELHRVRAEGGALRRMQDRGSITQMQSPAVQEELRERTRRYAAADVARLTGCPPPLPGGDE